MGIKIQGKQLKDQQIESIEKKVLTNQFWQNLLQWSQIITFMCN